jgi:4-alpha-glucanotransferase
MGASEDLRGLAKLYGIEPGYTDVRGKRRRLSDATARVLLEAMGAAVGSSEEIVASLREAEARPWRRMLEPVQVSLQSQPLELTLSLADRPSGARVRWRLVEEEGALHEGEALLDDLPVVAEAEVDGRRHQRWRLRLPDALPEGHHRLEMEVSGGGAGAHGAMRLILTPEHCLPAEEEEDHGRFWGLQSQLYGVRSERDWGMGDFTDLARLAETAASLGAAALGVNPLHALFPADAHHYSPYSPSSRFFLNVLYIDPEAVPDLEGCAEAHAMLADAGFRAGIERLRAADLIDYPAVARVKLPLLERLFASFRERHRDGSSARGRAFEAFRQEMGVLLERHAVFDALHEHALQTWGTWSWQHWPEGYQHPDSPEVAAFAREHRDRVDFFAWLQWQADAQLRDAQTRARRAGMPIGLYQDIAIAVNAASSMTWAYPGVSPSGVSVGAPPDWFSPNGQNWGLSPLSPVGLYESGYELFIASLRQNMRHAGAVRIDHVMGLKRLYWIPSGAGASEGAYVRYPFDDLVRLIALESRRHRCLVVGEDLGTVPSGFRPAMQQAGVMSCRVLYFERDRDQRFLPPDEYPVEALVSVSTHDLPTLKGFWTWRDVAWRELLELLPGKEAQAAARAERERDRMLLLKALEEADLLPEGVDPEHPPDELSNELIEAAHRFLARTPGRLLMIQLEDALGETEQPNLPGAEAHPNWRRRYARRLEDLTSEPLVRRIAAAANASGRGIRPGAD